MEAVATQAVDLIDHIKEMDPDQRHEKLRKLDIVLLETLKRGEEKVALAKSTFDAVRVYKYVCVCV
jgi:inhibitor of growth protein 5/inhibitor of growth protein 4